MKKAVSLVQTPLSEIFATLEVLDKLGVTGKDLVKIRRDKRKAKQIAELIMSGKKSDKKVATGIYKVVVNYGETLAQIIKAGNYDWVDGDINNKHFPTQGTGQHEVKLVLVHLDQDATTKEALEHLNSLGLEPAKVEHLLALGVEYPNVFQEFPIIALGSVWVDGDGNRRYPYLDCEIGPELSLSCDDDDNQWHYNWRFLALGE
ncbi:hypothetical protein JW977_04725 [Candidatus Falkowbacteria bacterium]|nr:hypothetical protein [Candidatus Falkowbacteria bacterium]